MTSKRCARVKLGVSRLRGLRFVCPLSLTVALVFGPIVTVQSQPFSVLHDFDPAGGNPVQTGLLAQGRDGRLYGTTSVTTFRISPAGEFRKLHDFDYTDEFAREGYNALGGLTLGRDGNFYGTTAGGGASGTGTVFKMTPAGVVAVLHSFSRDEAGYFGVYGAPVEGRDGHLYGTTSGGKKFKYGTVYKLTKSGEYTTLYRFDGWHGANPQAPLIGGADGNFYGTTNNGGAQWGSTGGWGTVFRITPHGKLKTLYSFDDAHGAFIQSPVVQGFDRNIYGTTANGGMFGSGTVFKLTPTGVITMLHHFGDISGAEDGGTHPIAGLVQGSDGNFYGATAHNGNGLCGTLFRVTPEGAYSVLWTFDWTTGCSPAPTPFLHTNGRVYGLTSSGGAFGSGTLYRLDVGAPGFVAAIPNAAKAGTSIGLLGALSGTAAVSFNGIDATFFGTGSTYRTAVVPTAMATGLITATTPAGKRETLKAFKQLPVVTRFSPDNGEVGTEVVLTGNGLGQTVRVKFGGCKAAAFVIDSATQVTATVPAGAIGGKIIVVTKGGTTYTASRFIVTP